MARQATTTDVSPGDDALAVWADKVRADLLGLFADKTLHMETDGATVTFDLDNSLIQGVELGGNRVLAVDNVVTNRPFFIRLAQDATGSRVPTWWAGIKWPNNVAPTLSTVGGEIDAFMFIPTAAGVYDGYFVGFGLSS